MTDFEKIFNAFKEVGIKMIVAKDKSQIILLEGAEAGCETIYVGEWEFVNGDKDADGYCGFIANSISTKKAIVMVLVFLNKLIKRSFYGRKGGK